MNKIAVLCMNGFGSFGYWLDKKYRHDYMSDITRDAIAVTTYLHGMTVKLEIIKGRLTGLGSRKAREFIKSHNRLDYTLLMIGKSQGAYNIIHRVWNKLSIDEIYKYKKIALFCVDANHGPRSKNRNDESWTPNKSIDILWNMFQIGKLGGAQITGASNQLIPGTSVDHSNIVMHEKTRTRLSNILGQLA